MASPTNNDAIIQWSSLSEPERKKLIHAAKQENENTVISIDKKQKELAELRKSVPGQCEEMFNKSNQILLNHYINGTVFEENENGVDYSKVMYAVNERVVSEKNLIAEAQHYKEEAENLQEETKNCIAETRRIAQTLLNKI